MEHTLYSGKTIHSVTTLSIDFDRTCSSRFGNELNVESVPLNLAREKHPDIYAKFLNQARLLPR